MELSNWEVTDEGLIIRCTSEESKELKEILDEKGSLDAEFDSLEHATCNGLSYVLPEDIGALTSATILSNGDNLYSDFKYYQIRSFVEDLIDNQEAILHKVS